MRSSNRRGCQDDSPRRAFARVGWEDFSRRTGSYAVGTLHLAPLDADQAGVVEAADLVNTLVELALAGNLIWNLPEDATGDCIIRYACEKLRGLCANWNRHAAFSVADDTLDERAHEGPDALSLLVEQQGLRDLLQAFARDSEAQAHVAMMLEGKVRTEIAEELGCTASRADAVRKRIFRGTAAISRAMNDEGEDEPPPSAPESAPDGCGLARRRR
jgi:hypothetical protein